ncbi:MAG: hypothetical protein LUI06_05415 [Ruminococcus sp.]|nr:hypothetical protein [Ruminococcus sp.]
MSKTDFIKKYRVPAIIIILLIFAAVSSFVAVRASDSNIERTTSNEFDPVDIKLEVIESGLDSSTDSGSSAKTNTVSWTDSGDDKIATKPVQVKVLSNDDTSSSTNTAPSYIRVALVPRFVTTVVVEETDSYGSVIDSSSVDVDVMAGANAYETDSSQLDTFDDINKVTVSGNSFKNGDVTFNLVSDWSDNWLYCNGYFYYKKAVDPGETTAQLLESVSISGTTYNTLDKYGLELEIDVLTDGIQTEGGAVDARWTDVEISTDGTLSVSD